MSEWGWNDLEMRESGDVSYIRDSTRFPRQKTSASCITWKEVNLGVWMTFLWGMRWKWQKWYRNDEMKVGWGIFFIQGFRLRSKIPPHFPSIRHSDIILGRHLSLECCGSERMTKEWYSVHCDFHFWSFLGIQNDVRMTEWGGMKVISEVG